MKPFQRDKNDEPSTSRTEEMETEISGAVNHVEQNDARETHAAEIGTNMYPQSTEPRRNEPYDPSWNQAVSRRTKQALKKELKAKATAESGATLAAPAEKTAPRFNVAFKRRTPNLPKEDFKIIIRPKKGLQLSSFTVPQLTQAIARACPSGIKNLQDAIVRPKWTSNIILVSTPTQDAANELRNLQSLYIGGKKYDVVSYVAYSEHEVKGVVHGFEPGTSSAELLAGLRVRTLDTKIVFARMLGKSTTALITFEGNTVPRAVYFYGGEMTCYLYKATRLVCQICRKTGHRADVCPEPNINICARCGEERPNEDHSCSPRCALCKKGHLTGAKECELKFRNPRIPPGNRSKPANQQKQPRWFDDEWPELQGRQVQEETQPADRTPQTRKEDALQKKRSKEAVKRVSWTGVASQDLRQSLQKSIKTDEINELKKLILDIKAENAMLREKLEKYERAQHDTGSTTAGFQNPREQSSADTSMWQQLQDFRKEMRAEIRRLIAEMVVSRTSPKKSSKRKLSNTQGSKTVKHIVMQENSNMSTEESESDDDIVAVYGTNHDA